MRKFKSNRVTIKRPGGTRKSFGLVHDTTLLDGKRTQKTLKLKALDSINEQFREGLFDYNHALYLVERIKKDFEREFHIKSNSEELIQVNKVNSRIVSKFMNEKYDDTEMKESSLRALNNEFQALLRSLGEKSLVSVTKRELRDCVKRSSQSIGQQNKILTRANALMSFLKRDIKLSKFKNPKIEPKFLTENELQTLLVGVESNFDRDAFIILFYTGLRVGELFALKESDIKSNGQIYVNSQMERKSSDYSVSLPKGYKSRTTVCFEEGRDALNNWFTYSKKRKMRERENLSRRLKNYSTRAFKSVTKHISSHDLRHSFAKLCLEKGLSMGDIAMLLGNREDVAQEHYAGWALHSEAITRIMNSLE